MRTCPCRCPQGLEPGLSDEAFFEPANNTYPFGCHISMLEIDRETGEPKLLKLVAVDDAGNLINPLIVEGQIHGGLAQGDRPGDDRGSRLQRRRPAAHRLVHGLRVAAGDRFSALRAGRHGDADARCNPFGAKGVGEAGTLGSTPSIVNAAVDALSGFGVKHIDMMLRPEKLWRMIQGGQVMIPAEFEYARASSIEDAIARLKASDGAGKIIAGGHSLVPMMKLRLAQPTLLIDIARNMRGRGGVMDEVLVGDLVMSFVMLCGEVGC